jgi:hypothetical protein
MPLESQNSLIVKLLASLNLSSSGTVQYMLSVGVPIGMVV